MRTHDLTQGYRSILDLFKEPTPEQIAAAPAEAPVPAVKTPWRITTAANQHLTAHDKQMIAYCLENKVDACETRRKRVAVYGGNWSRGILPHTAEIQTRETNSFGKVETKTWKVAFSVNVPKPAKPTDPNQAELFA